MTTTPTTTAPIEIPAYDTLFPYRSLYHRIDNLLLKLPQEEAFNELSYVILNTAELTSLDPTLSERSNADLRNKLSLCRTGGSGTILLKGKTTQIPVDVFDHVMQIASSLDIGELHAIALYAEAAPAANINGIDPCQASVELFYEERLLLLRSFLELIPNLVGQDDGSSMYIRNLLMDRTKPINLVQQMLAIISKFVPLYNASVVNQQQRSSFVMLRDLFYRQILQYTSSILFYSYHQIDNSLNSVENLILIIETLKGIGSTIETGNGACQFVVSKLILTCLNAFAPSDDSSNAPVMDLKRILSDIDAWSGEAECIRGVLISAYAIYLDTLSSTGLQLPHGLHVDELNKYLREAYEFCIFSYIRSKLIPSFLFDETEACPSSMDQTFFLGVIVDFVGNFTSMATTYNDLPQTLAQWKEDQDYNAQLSHTQEDYSDRDDVLEDIVELIIELCRRRHESALQFYTFEFTNDGKQELTLSSFVQDFCLKLLPIELGSTLLLALCHEDGACVVNTYLQSRESPTLNWDNFCSIVSQYSQKRYYSAYNATSLDIEAVSDVYQVKVVLSLIARCAAIKEIRKSLVASPNNMLQIVISFPVACLESLCAAANMIESDKTLITVLEWIYGQNINNPDVLTTRGLLHLYYKILRYMSSEKDSTKITSVKVNKATDSFLKDCIKWGLSQSNDASVIYYALECIALEPNLSSDDKICKILLQLLVRSSDIDSSDNCYKDFESKISPLLRPKPDFIPLLLSILCQMETQYVLLDVKNIMTRLAELMTKTDATNIDASLKYMQHLIKHRDLWLFIFDSTIIKNSFIYLLGLPEYASQCVQLLSTTLPASMEFIFDQVDLLVTINDQYNVTNLLCAVQDHSGHRPRQILLYLHKLGYFSRALRDHLNISLPHLSNLINLYSSELFVTKFSRFEIELVSNLIPRIGFKSKPSEKSEVLALTDGTSNTMSDQVKFNCAYGRIMALLSSNANIMHANDLIFAVLFQIKCEIKKQDVEASCFYPIALGLFDFCTKKKDLIEPIRGEIANTIFAILSDVGAVAGAELFCLLLAIFSGTNSNKEYLELVVKIYSEYGLRSESMTTSILCLLGICDTNTIDYNILGRLANVNDIKILAKMAEGREGASLLVQYGAPVRVINDMPSITKDPEVLVPVLNLLLGIQKHFDVSPEISQVLIRNDAFIRQHLLHQFPYFADVTEVCLQALISSKDTEVHNLYGQTIYEFMKILMRFPLPSRCLEKIAIPGLEEETLGDGVCWWNALPAPTSNAFSLPVPPVNTSARNLSHISWTNEHYDIANTAVRILDLCACYLIKVYRTRAFPGVLSVCATSCAGALCRFVNMSHALDSYYVYSKDRFTSSDEMKNVEMEFISRLGSNVARFSERLIVFLTLHLKLSIDIRSPDTNELARSFKLALDYCRVDFNGVGFSSDRYREVMIEEKKQGDVMTASFSQKTSSLLRELVERIAPGIESLSHRERTGLIPRDKVAAHLQ